MNARQRIGKAPGSLVAVSVLAVALVMTFLPAAGAAKSKCFGHKATIVGTNADDELEGTNGRDVIVGRGGNDTIDAKGGRDFVCAGGGDFDVVYGREGNDKIAGGGGFDVMFPATGNDFVDGGSGGGFVTYEGSSAPINANLKSGVITGQGRDEVRRVDGVGGSESDDVLVGTNRFDDLEGFGGNDVVNAGGAGDFINAGAGNDTITGGAGADDFLDLVVAHGGPGIGDDVLATSGAVVDMPAGTVTGGADVGTDTFTGIEGVGATLGNDTIIGTAGHNHLAAFDGTDNLQGGDGDDFLAPGPADDVVDGGAGDDVVDFFLSHPFEGGSHGPVNVDLAAQSATGQGNDELASIEGAIGTLLDDTLVGSDVANFLLGDEGSDTISGGLGDDYLDGDAFFFDLPENLPGEDSLNGGPGQDTCVGGETNQECETLGDPGSAARGGPALRVVRWYFRS